MATLSTTCVLVQEIRPSSLKAFAANTVMKVDPTNSTANVGHLFDLNVTVADVTNLYGWQFKLYFLNSILNCTNIAEGPFLNSIGYTFPILDIENNFNSTHGRVLAACTLKGADVSANGTGVIATLTFNATTLGDSSIVLQETKLLDNESPPQPIPYTPIGGDVNVVIPPEQVVDIYTQRGGVGANVSSDSFAPGDTVSLNASLIFQGAPVPGIIVQFITYDPHGTPTARNSVSGPDGVASINFTIQSNPVFGNYVTLASATVNGNSYNDTVSYQVGWIINIIQIVLCNCTGYAQAQFPRGSLVYLNITLQNIAFNPKQLFLHVHTYDGSKNPVGIDWISCAIPAGKTNVFMGFRIPYWSISGVGQIYVAAYDKPFWVGDYQAYCPDNYVPLSISGG